MVAKTVPPTFSRTLDEKQFQIVETDFNSHVSSLKCYFFLSTIVTLCKNVCKIVIFYDYISKPVATMVMIVNLQQRLYICNYDCKSLTIIVNLKLQMPIDFYDYKSATTIVNLHLRCKSSVMIINLQVR